MQQQMAVQKIYEVHDIKSLFEYIDSIKISPEIYALFFMGLTVWYLRRSIKASEDLQARWHRMVATILSKKYFAWAVITFMFWYDHFVWGNFGDDSLSFESYLAFTCVTFGIDVWQKKIGLDQKQGE